MIKEKKKKNMDEITKNWRNVKEKLAKKKFDPIFKQVDEVVKKFQKNLTKLKNLLHNKYRFDKI